MLIATFGSSTAWQGQRITWDKGRFLLDGHGPIGAADVMEYDRQGHLVWETAGTRAWVGSKADSATRGGARRPWADRRPASAATPQPEVAVQSGSESRRTIVLKRVTMVASGTLVIVNAVLLLMFLGVIPRP
jgi:hypothetical protein